MVKFITFWSLAKHRVINLSIKVWKFQILINWIVDFIVIK